MHIVMKTYIHNMLETRQKLSDYSCAQCVHELSVTLLMYMVTIMCYFALLNIYPHIISLNLFYFLN